MKRFWSIPLMLMLFACQTPKESREELSLAGCWELRLDSTDVTEQVQLPGTTDTNQKGYPNNDKEETTHLSRPFRYQGKAWYQKEITIPENWEGKSIWLILERTKPTQIWVDSIYVGSSDHISTPQEYDLSTYLRAGKHHLTILVDNGLSVPPQLLDNSHAYTESTQTNWNGIIGDLKLEARPQFHIRRIQVYPHADQKTVDVKIKLSNPFEQMIVAAVQIEMEAFNTGLEHHIKFNKNIVVQQDEIIFQIPMGDDALEWSEFSPTLYRLTANIQGENIQDSQSTTFGLRDFKAEGTQFNINGLTTSFVENTMLAYFRLQAMYRWIPQHGDAISASPRNTVSIIAVSIHGVLLKLVSRRPISKVFTSNRNYLSGERWKRAIPL